MPKDKKGKQLTWKEFFKKWGEGIEGITPYQQAVITYKSTWIILLGIAGGLIMCLLNMKTLWWLFLILLGALFNSIIVQLGNYQKYKALRDLEESIDTVYQDEKEVNQK